MNIDCRPALPEFDNGSPSKHKNSARKVSFWRRSRISPLAATFSTLSLLAYLPANAAEISAATADDDALEGIVVTAGKTTRSSVVIGEDAAQKLLPGISPLKAIQTLPGVVYQTADPWGNNEQNASLVIRLHDAAAPIPPRMYCLTLSAEF